MWHLSMKEQNKFNEKFEPATLGLFSQGMIMYKHMRCHSPRVAGSIPIRSKRFAEFILLFSIN